GDLGWRRVTVELLRQLAGDLAESVDDLDHVDGHPDRARLVGERTADRLADPPGRVGRELEAAPVVELADRAHQAEVALLDQVEERQTVAEVALGDRDDQPQVSLDQAGARDVAALAAPQQLDARELD